MVELPKANLSPEAPSSLGSSPWNQGPALGVDGTGLWWRAVELEASVSDNGTNSSGLVLQDTVVQLESQGIRSNNGLLDVVGVLGGRGSNGVHLSVLNARSNSSCWVLDATIGNLGSNISSSSSALLDLSVTDLVDNRGSSAFADLSVTNAVDNGSSSAFADLSVTDLVNDRSSSLFLDLSVTDAVDDRSSSALADLSVTDLVDDRRGSGGSLLADLSVTNLVDDRGSGSSGLLANLSVTDAVNYGSCSGGLLANAAIVDAVDDRGSSGGLSANATVVDLVDVSLLGVSGGAGRSRDNLDGQSKQTVEVRNGVDRGSECFSWSQSGPRRLVWDGGSIDKSDDWKILNQLRYLHFGNKLAMKPERASYI